MKRITLTLTNSKEAPIPISIIAAFDANSSIGYEGKIQWDLSEDMRRFRGLTLGSVVIMGRKTWESLPNKLDKRINVVLSKQGEVKGADATFDNLTDAIKAYQADSHLSPIYDLKHIWIIGGGEIYEQAIDLADHLYLTHVNGSFKGDTYFPKFQDKFEKIFELKKHKCSFTVWDRI